MVFVEVEVREDDSIISHSLGNVVVKGSSGVVVRQLVRHKSHSMIENLKMSSSKEGT